MVEHSKTRGKRSADSALKKRNRIAVDLSDADVKRLDTLQELTDAATRAEVVRHALRFYEWLLKEQTKGNEIHVGKKGEEHLRIVVLP